MIRDLSALDRPQLNLTCSLCVVGAGLAGLMVAARAAARLGDHPRVVVLESGGPKPLPQFDALNEVDQALATYRSAMDGRVRALGGTSNVWGGRMIPLTAHDLGARDYLGLAAWPIDKADLDRFTPDIERLFGLDQSPYDALGLPTGDLTARLTKWSTFRRRNIAHDLRAVLSAKRGPEVWHNATVCKLEVDAAGGLLASVTATSLNGKSLTVRADRFVLSAGTLETTRLLLMLNEIANRRALSPALGRYFNDHLKIDIGRLNPLDRWRTNRIFGYRLGSTRRSLHLETTASVQRASRAPSGYLSLRVEYQALSLYGYARLFGKAVQSRRLPEPPKAETLMDLGMLAPAAYWRARHKQMYLGPLVDLFVEARVEQTPNAESRLTLTGRRDQFGAPILKMDWRKTALDLHAFETLLAHARRFWRSSGLEATSPIVWSVAPGADLLALARETHHPAGSARMGLDRHSSVVSPRLACHGVPNVFVVSAAAFPSSGSANPTMTILQLACRTAETIAGVHD